VRGVKTFSHTIKKEVYNMVSEYTITTISQRIVEAERNRIGDSLRNAFKGERISEKRIERILDRFLVGLKSDGI